MSKCGIIGHDFGAAKEFAGMLPAEAEKMLELERELVYIIVGIAEKAAAVD